WISDEVEMQPVDVVGARQVDKYALQVDVNLRNAGVQKAAGRAVVRPGAPLVAQHGVDQAGLPREVDVDPGVNVDPRRGGVGEAEQVVQGVEIARPGDVGGAGLDGMVEVR